MWTFIGVAAGYGLGVLLSDWVIERLTPPPPPWAKGYDVTKDLLRMQDSIEKSKECEHT